MRTSPYDTAVCRHYKQQQIIIALQRADIESPLPTLATPVGNKLRDAFVVTPSRDYEDVNGFTQPINIGTADKSKWVVDGRPFMRVGRSADSYSLVSENDFTFQCIRLALTQSLEERGNVVFSRLGEVPAKAFVRWITLALAQRFNLDLEQQINVSIICGYYYFTQLSETLQLTPEEKQLRASRVASMVGVNPTKALEVGEQLGDISSAQGLADAIANFSGSVRLAKLNFADLYTIIVGSWVGVNARENVGVALEHIPTLIAIMFTALDEKSYRKTILSQRIQSVGRQNDLKMFTDAVFRQVSSRFE